MSFATWKEIRANWVNGNRSDARLQLTQLPKHKLIDVIADCVFTYYRQGQESGDLQDLYEILKSREINSHDLE